jgi:glycosyltransferase involved in cell wall biosynthesis
MRVLICSDYYPPFIGGGQRWTQLLARGLRERGHEVAVLTAWSGGQRRLETAEGWPVYRIRQLRTWPTGRVRDTQQRQLPPFPDPVSVRDAAEVIDLVAPEVCITYGWITMSILARLRRRGIPVILSSHDYGNVCATRTLLNHGEACSGPQPTKCLRCATDFYGTATGAAAVAGVLGAQPRLRRSIAGLHSVSRFVDETTWGHLFGPPGPGRPVHRFVIPAFVETPSALTPAQRVEFAPYLRQLPEEPYIFFAGALRRLKGVEVLLEAYSGLPEPRPPLVMVGARYPDTPAVLPAGVRIIESAPQRVVVAALERALIAVFPSLWAEPLGLVAIEAAGSGVATIATAPGGFVDILGDGAGVLVARGSVAELRAAMSALLRDPESRRAVAEAGIRAARRFQADVVLGEYEAALQTVIATAGPPGNGPHRRPATA